MPEGTYSTKGRRWGSGVPESMVGKGRGACGGKTGHAYSAAAPIGNTGPSSVAASEGQGVFIQAFQGCWNTFPLAGGLITESLRSGGAKSETQARASPAQRVPGKTPFLPCTVSASAVTQHCLCLQTSLSLYGHQSLVWRLTQIQCDLI